MWDYPPSFFILGTQKGGTSTLHYWLSQNPRLSLPKLKETHFFSHTDRYNNGLDWYYRWFAPKGRDYIRGEVDPSYLFFPDTPHRIKKLCPNPQFIIILREPLSRAYSHYLMSVQRGYETLDFVQALEAEPSRLLSDPKRFSFKHHSYLTRGRYTEQISRYKTLFPKSEFLFLKFDDLSESDSRRKMYQQICDFIGVEPETGQIDLDSVVRSASTSRSKFIRNLVYSDVPLRRFGKKLIPSAGFRAHIINLLDKMNRKKIKKKDKMDIYDIPENTLINIDREIDVLFEMTGLDLDHWRHRTNDGN